jgi:hypothetical protein
MLFREIVDVYCENHAKHINILYGHNGKFYCVEAGGTHRTTLGLEGLKSTCFLDISQFTANLRASLLHLNHICYYVAYINRHMQIHVFLHSFSLYSKWRYACFYCPLCPLPHEQLQYEWLKRAYKAWSVFGMLGLNLGWSCSYCD